MCTIRSKRNKNVWVDTAEECHQLRREIKRLKAWIRRWPNRFLYSVETFRATEAMQPDTFADEIRDCLKGKAVPRKRASRAHD